MWHPARILMCALGLAGAVAAARGEGPVQLRLPPDLVYDRAVGAEGAVTFRHSTHVGFADAKCGVCHPAPFRMLRPSRETTHELMDKAESCGTCHDGRKAFATNQEAICARCHTGWGNTQEVYPPDAPIRGGGDSPGPVTFRHATHRGPDLSCGECHLPRFERGTGGALAGASPASSHDTCGSCHNGTRAVPLEEDAGCPRCHISAEAGR